MNAATDPQSEPDEPVVEEPVVDEPEVPVKPDLPKPTDPDLHPIR
ncbi:MAG: hypothetical protein AB7H43_07765 [Acidimicrobiia bacterium]